jgi:hypothetical protein
MTTPNTVDAARVELLLSELRLPSIKLRWAKLAEQSDTEGWPAARFAVCRIRGDRPQLPPHGAPSLWHGSPPA